MTSHHEEEGREETGRLTASLSSGMPMGSWRKVHALEQVRESRIRTKIVESGFDFEQHHAFISLSLGPLQPGEDLIGLSQGSIDLGPLVWCDAFSLGPLLEATKELPMQRRGRGDVGSVQSARGRAGCGGVGGPRALRPSHTTATKSPAGCGGWALNCRHWKELGGRASCTYATGRLPAA
jgi:hypothetical protein